MSVQPRIRLHRSFDERWHTYHGYVLRVRGSIGDEARDFLVAVGEGAHAQHAFRAGDALSGEGVPVADPRREIADIYKVSKLQVASRATSDASAPPPWYDVAPELPVYRARGHRRLAARTFDTTCAGCLWGCRMAVEMTIDHWNPKQKRYRAETFCYGPLSCPRYKAGPTRKVPGRRGMSYEEPDWVDEDATGHRDPNE